MAGLLKATPGPYVFQGVASIQGRGQQIAYGLANRPGRIGTVQLFPAANGAATLTGLHVEPAHRRNGVGSQLIQAALRVARAQGYHTVTLEARPTSSGITTQALVNLYRNAGFRPAGISPRQNPTLAYQLGKTLPAAVQPYRQAVQKYPGAMEARPGAPGTIQPGRAPSYPRPAFQAPNVPLRYTPLHQVPKPAPPVQRPFGPPVSRWPIQRMKRKHDEDTKDGPSKKQAVTGEDGKQTAVDLSKHPHRTRQSFTAEKKADKPFEFEMTPVPPKEEKKKPKWALWGTPEWRKSKYVALDKHGNEIFLGERDDNWLPNFYEWFEGRNPTLTCDGKGAHSQRYDIDHKTSFYAHLENKCAPHEVCDKVNHWRAYVARFAVADQDLKDFPIHLKSKNENSVTRMYHDNNNLRWRCKTHNLRKSKRDRHNPDKLFDLEPYESCPGDGKCKL